MSTIPHSIEAERGVLGSVLMDAEKCMDIALAKSVTPDWFFSDIHNKIFEALQLMHRNGEYIDLLTVSEKGPFGDVLEDAIDGTPTSAHLEGYIRVLKENHIKRLLFNVCSTINAKILEGDDGGADALELVGEAEEAIFALRKQDDFKFRDWRELVESGADELLKTLAGEKTENRIPSGLANLDNITGGFTRSDVIILAARPSMGKTSLALSIAQNIALAGSVSGKPVLLFSLEMSEDQITKRMICSEARVCWSDIQKGVASPTDEINIRNAANLLATATIHIDATASLSSAELRARARLIMRKHPVGLVIIDYLQLMHHNKYSRDNRQREVSAISSDMKAMAKELDVPVLLLSQLNRAAENRDKLVKPRLSDLRDSGSIEQDADIVMLLRRPCIYPDDPHSDDRKLAVIDVAKNRNGPTGEVHLDFDEEWMLFSNRMDDPDTVEVTCFDEEQLQLMK